MKYFNLFLFGLFIPFLSFSQIDYCKMFEHGNVAVYDTSEIIIEKNVVYGNALNWLGQNQPLVMDIYRPPSTVTVSPRPLIAVMHGGAFISGTKDAPFPPLALELARRGYVVINIEYRLGFDCVDCTNGNPLNLCFNANTDSKSPASIQAAQFRAMQDYHAALRYMAHHATQYNVNPLMFFVGGDSAGALTSLHLTYLEPSEDPYKLEGILGRVDTSGNDYSESFKIQGVLSWYGAIIDTAVMDEPIPLLMFHGTGDVVVPFLYDHLIPFCNLASNPFPFAYGSKWMNKRMKNAGVCAELNFKTGGAHDYSIYPLKYYIDHITCFLRSTYCNTCSNKEQENVPVDCSLVANEEVEEVQLQLFPNPATDLIHIRGMESIGYLEIQDILGKKYLNITTTTASLDIPVISWPAGIYQVLYRQQDGSVYQQLVMLSK